MLTDVYISGGVLVGVALFALTGWLALDPAIAGLVVLNIMWAGWGMVREAAGGLMDEAAPPEIVGQGRALIADRAGGALKAHDLRTRHAGRVTFVEFHLVVPRDMQVGEAHAICDRVDIHPHLFDRSLYLGRNVPISGTAHQAGTMRFGRDPAT